MLPLGWTFPYSSITLYLMPFGTRGDVPGLILPDMVTKTDLPFGGHSEFGLAAQLTLGGVCGTPFMLVIVTPPVPLPGAGGAPLAVSATPPNEVPLKLLSHVH